MAGDQSEKQEREKLPYFDPYRAPGSPRMAGIVADVIQQLQNFEAVHAPRKRRRRPADQRTFEATVAAVVCDLAHRHVQEPEGHVAVSLSHRVLGTRSRYRSRVLGTKLPDVLKHLASPELAFVELTKGFRTWAVDFDDGDDSDAEGRIVNSPSVIRAGPRLITRLIDHSITLEDIGRDDAEEVIILKAPKEDHWDKGRYIDYVDNPETKRMREEVREINAWLKEADLDADTVVGEEPVDLTRRRLPRVFNDGTFARGGRLFGGFWQNMKAERRREDLFINGEPGIELDYGQMALRLLYAKVGAEPPPGDLYDIPELTSKLSYRGGAREGIKKVINAALSHDQPQKRMPQGTRQLFPRWLRYSDIIEPIKRRHHAVADHFFTGVGVELMRTEADLMVALLLALKDQGIVALPIHDAVVVPEGTLEATEETMARVFRTSTGLEPVISIETG